MEPAHHGQQQGVRHARKGIHMARIAILTCIAWCLSCLALPLCAYGSIPRIGDTMHGTCFIVDTGNPNTDLFPVTFQDGNLNGTWTLYCMDHTAAAPADVWATYTAIVVNVDVAGGTVAYRLYVTPPNATDGHTYLNGMLAGYQHVGGSITVGKDFGGWVNLQKTSSNTALTADNPCYSLEGASFGVFSDAYCTNRVATLITDSAGNAQTDILESGSYWIRELNAPRGFALTAEIQEIHVSSGQTAWVRFSDAPQANPIDWLLSKVDSSTGGTAQGNGSLQGAQFSIEFYPGWFDAYTLPRTAAGSWTFETDAEGRIRTGGSNSVTGPLFLLDESGKPLFPLGTIALRETRAPVGYLPDPTVHIVHITPEGTGPSVRTYRAPAIRNTVQRGDIRLVKEVPTTNDEEQQETSRMVVEGVRFQIINESTHPIVSPETGQVVAPGQTACTITTDENGFASTRNNRANGWSIPDGWTGALAYGDYRIHEVIPDHIAQRYKDQQGIVLLPVEDFSKSIVQEGSYESPTLVSNHIPLTPLRVIKRDAETGSVIPLPCSFQIICADGDLLTYTDRTDGAITDRWSTGPNGSITLPMKLDGGNYQLREIEAPQGYLLNEQTIPFTVDAWRTWENPLVIELSDVPAKGTIEICKTDAETGIGTAGAAYTIRATCTITTPDGTVRVESGEIVDTCITDEHGYASSIDLYPGPYAVREIENPLGYAIDTHERSVLVASDNQAPRITYLAVEDSPTKVEVHKRDALSHAPLAGAIFRVWRETPCIAPETSPATSEANQKDRLQDVVKSDQGHIPSYNTTITTDENGYATLSKLVPGTYCIQETEAPWGYGLTDTSVRTFTVSEQGLIEGASKLSLDVFDTPTSIRTTALDRASGTQGTIASEESCIVDYVACEGLVAGATYFLSGQLMNAETGDSLALEGSTACKEFIAASAECVVEMEYAFDSRKLDNPSVVVFESLSCEGREVVSHANLEDSNQTVTYARKGELYPQTGVSPTELLKTIMPLAAIAVASGIHGALRMRTRRRKACRYTWEQANTRVP